MNISSFFNPQEALEQGQAVLKKQAQVTAQTAKGQITGQNASQQAQSDAAKTAGGDAVSDKMNQDFINDMYAPSDMPAKTQSTAQPTNPVLAQLQGSKPTAGDQAQLAATRKKLEDHMNRYFKPTFEQRPSEEEPQGEKVERQKQEEENKRWELQQEEKKKNEVPMAVQQAMRKAEVHRGAAG